LLTAIRVPDLIFGADIVSRIAFWYIYVYIKVR
jgi:hypothetical protein